MPVSNLFGIVMVAFNAFLSILIEISGFYETLSSHAAFAIVVSMIFAMESGVNGLTA